MENKPKPVDRRVLKTKRAIRNAFAKLMAEKDINDITIMELAETADINRKTFYNYYSGVYQVVEDIEHDILSSYAELLGGVEFREYMDAPVSLFNRFSQLINMDPEFFGYLLTMNGNISLITRIMRLLQEKTCEVMVAQLEVEAGDHRQGGHCDRLCAVGNAVGVPALVQLRPVGTGGGGFADHQHHELRRHQRRPFRAGIARPFMTAGQFMSRSDNSWPRPFHAAKRQFIPVPTQDNPFNVFNDGNHLVGNE